MSSMRNAVSRRPHRERAQPESRQKWGLLEKHKDYTLRAQDYNVKKKKLAQLSTKATQKNPDEFAFGMLSKDKGRTGKHGQGSEENRLSHDAIKLLKSQDAGYLRVVSARGRKEIQRVTEEIGIGKDLSSRKKVFDGEEIPARGVKRNADGLVLQNIDINIVDEHEPVTIDEVDENVVNTEEVRTNIRKSKKVLGLERDSAAKLRTEQKRRKRLQELRAAKLEALKKRQKEILAAADQLELQRAKMARTVGGVNKDGVKFKVRERKR